MSIPQVDGLSIDPRDLGRHRNYRSHRRRQTDDAFSTETVMELVENAGPVC